MIIVEAKLNGTTHTINGIENKIQGNISQEVKAAIDSFSFKIFPNNAGYSLIFPRKTRIKAINNKTGRVEFNGRVLLAPKRMDSDGKYYKNVTCESLLGYLQDSFQPYMEEQTMPLNDFIDLVLANHNAQTEAEKHITRGTVNVTVAGTGNVTKGLQYQSTYETLKTKLVDVFGGDLQVVEDDNGNLKLNYVQEIGQTRATEIRLGRNMQEAERAESPLEIVTRVIPLGAKLKTTETDADGNETEVETEERLTLVGYAPAGKPTFTNPWVDDEDKIDALGIIVGILDFPDVTVQSNLYSKTIEFLTAQNRLLISHTITALDLSENGQDIDSFNCGDSYPVYNSLIDISDTLRIIKKTFDINNPYKGSLTFGDKKASLSSMTAAQRQSDKIVIEQLQKNISELQNKTERTNTRVTTFGGSITETVEAAIAERFRNVVTIDDLNQLEERTIYRTTETADGLRQEFETQITTTETDINGNVSTQFEDLKAYIDYGMDENGRPYIILLKNNSDYSHEITNEGDTIKENGIVSSGFSKGQSFADNGVFNKSVAIGNFIWRILNDGTFAL